MQSCESTIFCIMFIQEAIVKFISSLISATFSDLILPPLRGRQLKQMIMLNDVTIEPLFLMAFVIVDPSIARTNASFHVCVYPVCMNNDVGKTGSKWI